MNLAKYIDHTLLKPESTRADIARICEEAKHYGTASVCVNPFWVGFVAEQLKDSDVKACCVIGFPLGATLPSVKAFETDEAIKNGAQEVDMVINVGAARGGEWDVVQSAFLRPVCKSGSFGTVRNGPADTYRRSHLL